MKAYPKRFAAETFESKLSPGTVYHLTHIHHAIRNHIESVNVTDERMFDIAGIAYDLIGFSLKAIDGLEDWTPEFVNAKIGKRTFKRLTDESIDAIPRTMYDEINKTLQTLDHLEPDEIEAIKNMRNSSQAIDSMPVASAPEDSTSVPSESQNQSPPEPTSEC